MCSLRAVSLLLCLFLNDDWWRLYLVLNLHSVSPVYVSFVFVSLLVTVAWYTTLSVRHFPCSGQVLCVLQLHVLSCCCVCDCSYFDKTVLLWPEMMFCMFGSVL